MAGNDFNPFDLSAFDQKKSAITVDEIPQSKPQKAVVKRVTIGPLLHSRFTKIFVFLGFLFFLAFGSYSATQWWLLNRR